MGVKSLWALVRDMFPDALQDCAYPGAAFISLPRNSAINLLVDMNPILHKVGYSKHLASKVSSSSAPRAAASDNNAIDDVDDDVAAAATVALPSAPPQHSLSASVHAQHLVATSLDRLEKLVRTRKNGSAVKSVFVGIDGPPPLAKLFLQRSRREAISKKRQTTTNSLKFNGLNFTPGTLFMTKLDATLSYFATSIVDRYPNVEECRISGSRVPSEGETKIWKRLLEIRAERSRIPYSRSNNAVFDMVVTGDSDVVIQSEVTKSILLYNPDQRFVFTLGPVDQVLRSGILDSKVHPYHVSRVRHDLAFIFVFVFGNDCIPGCRGAKFERVWRVYCESFAKTGTFILNVENGSINLINLRKFLMAVLEEHRRVALVSGHSNESFENRLTHLEDYPDNRVEEYVDVLLWSLNSATTGQTEDFRLLYEHGSGPSIEALNDWIEKYNGNNIYWKGVNRRIRKRDALLPAVCAVALLPSSYKDLIDASFHSFMEDFEKKIPGLQQQDRDVDPADLQIDDDDASVMGDTVDDKPVGSRATAAAEKVARAQAFQIAVAELEQTIAAAGDRQSEASATMQFGCDVRARRARSFADLKRSSSVKYTSLLPARGNGNAPRVSLLGFDRLSGEGAPGGKVAFELLESGGWVWLGDVSGDGNR
ncbi:5'-3' exoribonuclease 1 [Entophlyctis luteolus]|nr:5'-3' exoribonuclease 1 [Entophlyctis luteolus]